ncbi:MAG TPA: GDSL-type esterase/lipase family protein [Bacteroidales bacterium]|jgi:lysophospholipase L1-like esterase|nr:lipolytic protein G-D-S-L family [Bacteroidales bacterium]HNR40649.1 GDSL-type esterase/lipase family protein [Bacteroidales bacterium]HQG77256.1 GDSL-type esterase/lipase family protein [Bacteroidales bacterium]
MREIKFILPVILACIPFICSDGQVNSNNLDLVFIGNSITQGDDPEKDSPPASSSEYIRTLRGVESVRFLNRGRSGYTTVDFLPAAGGELLNAIFAVREFHTDKSRQLVFSISLGTNDSAEEGPKGSPLHPEEYHFNLKAITDRLLADFPGCIVVYQQPIWYSPNTYNFSRYLKAGLERLQSYFPELQALVREYSQTRPGQVFMGDTRAFGYFKDNYLTDLIPESGNAGTFYLHPNKKGTEALGRFWGDGIYEALVLKRTGKGF